MHSLSGTTNNEIPHAIYLVLSVPTNPKWGGFPWDII